MGVKKNERPVPTGVLKYPTLAKRACTDCLYSYNREQWSKLLGCYFIFYGCLIAWFSIHLTVMVNQLPDRAAQQFTGTDLGGTGTKVFTIGEPNYWGFNQLALTLANEFNGNSLPSDTPWEKDEKPATSISTTNSYTYQQIRINNFYDYFIMRADQQVEVTCKGAATNGITAPLTFSEPTNPFLGYTYVSGVANNGVTVTIAANEIKVLWGEGAHIPQIVQYKIELSDTSLKNTNIQVTCSHSSAKDFESAPTYTVRLNY